MATQPTQTTQITSTIPEYATPYAQQLLGNVFGGQDPVTGQFIPGLVGQGYQPYGRQRTAGFSPLQQQAMEGIAGMQVSPELGEAAGLAGLAGRQAGQLGLSYQPMQYQPMGIDFMRTRAPRLQQFQMGPAERVGAERFGAQAMQDYMSPYMSGVVEQQKRGAIQDFTRQIPGLRAAAARSGALGGTREALMRSEAQRNLQSQLQGIEATGLQNAFQQAQQAQQFGANLGLQGLQQQLAAAGALGGLGMQGYQQRMGIGQAQLGAGAQGQALEQELLNQQYQDFINQQQFPYKQAEFGMGLLRGIPATGQVGTLYQQPPSLLGQIAGVGLGLGSLFGGLGGKSS
jgi:hypothetical protein